LKDKKNVGQLKLLFNTSNSQIEKELIVEALISVKDDSLISVIKNDLQRESNLSKIDSDLKYLLKISENQFCSIISKFIKDNVNKRLLVVLLRNSNGFSNALTQLDPDAISVISQDRNKKIIAILPIKISSRKSYNNIKGHIWVFNIEFYNISSEDITPRNKTIAISTKDNWFLNIYRSEPEEVEIPIKALGNFKYECWVRGENLRGGKCSLMFGTMGIGMVNIFGTGDQINIKTKLL